MGELDKKLKSYRAKNRLNQTEMAHLLGVSFRTYQAIEKSGDIKKSEVLNKIMQLLAQTSLSNPEEPYYEKRAKPENSPIPNEITQLVNSNAILAESNKKLVDMLHSTEFFSKEKELATSAMFRGLLDGIAEVAIGKKYSSKSEALKVLSKQIHEYVSAILIGDNLGVKDNVHK
jgi:DNA-binding XRE family transcriptional regulator